MLALGLCLVTFLLYLPSLRNRFIAYDDQQYVTENLRVQAGLTWDGVLWAFKNRSATNWHPLTWLSHMLDCQIYGLHPAGHHLTNALLHTANALLLFLLLHRMTANLWRSFAVAALFAWHPLHVESVAWVAERKDVLSGLFWMLTLWAYVSYVEAEGRRKWFPYSLSLFFFALGLMSKPMLVTLPFVMWLLDFWPLRRLQVERGQPCPRESGSPLRADKAVRAPLVLVIFEKVPFLILSGFSCALTLWAQQQAMVSTAGLNISQRLGHALLAYVHYAWVMLLPRHLAVFYPYDKNLPGGELFLAGALLALITAGALAFAKRWPYLLTGWFWFLGTLVPVIGLVQVGEQAWADRYTYLPYVGLFVAVVWAASDLAARTAAIRRALPWLGVAAGAACLALSSVQLSHWRNTRTLFEHVARVTERNPLSATLLGSLLATEGKYDEAIALYRTALSYSPGFPEAHFYLGHAYDQQGKLDEAIAEYQQAVWFKPIQEQTHIRLGIALAKQGKPEEAATHYLAALQANAESAVAHNNLARLLHSKGQLDEAIAQYSAALKLDPSLAQAHNNLGVLLLQKGQTAEGVTHLRRAVRLNPGDIESQINLAQGLADQGQWNEAAELFAKTVTGATTDPNLHCRFALVLSHLHGTREAMSEFAAALLLQQDFPDALDGLAWILVTDPDSQIRNGAQALPMAERACELTGRNDPKKLKTLSAAYAEVGRYPDAILTAQTASELAAKAGLKALANECLALRKQFEAGQPWRAQ